MKNETSVNIMDFFKLDESTRNRIFQLRSFIDMLFNRTNSHSEFNMNHEVGREMARFFDIVLQ